MTIGTSSTRDQTRVKQFVFVNVFLFDVKEKFSFAFGCCWEGERTTDFNI